MTDSPPATAGLPSLTVSRRDQQLRDLRFLETLEETLAGCGSEQAIYSSAAHRLAAAFDADSACLASYEPISGALEILHGARAKRSWEMPLLMQAVTEQHIVSAGGVLAAPIICDGSLWGVAAIARRPREGGPTYISSERQTLRAAAERIAAELEKRRTDLLDDVIDDLLRKTKPIDVYTHSLRELRRFIRYDHSASVMTMQRGVAQITVRVEKVVHERGKTETLVDSTRRGRPVRLTSAQARYLSRLRVPIEMTNEGDGWKPRGYPVGGPSHPDAAGLWRVFWHNGADHGSILCYPLIFGGQTLGFLCLTAKRAGAFDSVDRSSSMYMHVLDRFARLLSVTLYRSELYYQSDRQLQAIKEIGRTITSPMPVEEVCRQVLQSALRVLHVQVGAVGLLTEEGTLELVAHQGCTLPETPVLQVGQGISGMVVQSGKSWAVPDVKKEPAYVVLNNRVSSELVSPIIYDQEVIGFLDVESFEEGRFREEEEEQITFLEALANQAAIAIKTAQLRDEAMQLLGPSRPITRELSTAGFQDMLIEELRDNIKQLHAANRAKSEFLAHMSHDLRGPLNVIVGLSNLLTDPAVAPSLDEERRRESLELIRSNGEVLGSLIGNILDLSAVEAGKVQLTVAPFDSQPAFEYLCAVGKTLAAESHKELEVSFAVDPSITTITADEEKFLRIMHNLIANAVKFTPSGGRITMTATVDEQPGTSLHIAVADTGIGIDPEHHERIFQPFQQINSSTYRRYHGSGIGLAVVRQLVELHGGHVWVDSTPGEGSTFHVVLPNVLTPAAQPAPEEDSADLDDLATLPVPTSAGTRTVLVVEDIPAHMSMMRLAVTSRGYAMHGAGSGEEALAWLADHQPDVILLDMQLPGMDGFSVAANVKRQVETHAIPIIAVTADALSVNEERALASGCDFYLTKPIDIATLLATIDRAMSREGV